MESRAGGTTTLPRNKGATLPGFRVGPVRYGVRLGPPSENMPARRCSEGDLGAPSRPSGEEVVVRKVVRSGSGPYNHQTLIDNRQECSGGRATSDLAPRGSDPSPLHLKEAHSLLNNRWAPLTVPACTALLPPASPRPHGVRRSFNASPRPWVAPTQVEDAADNKGSDNNSDNNSGASGRWRVAPTDGASAHTNALSLTDPLKLSPHPPPEAGGWPSLRGGPRPAPPLIAPADVATFRSDT
ncbi:hypothetical protein OTU49_015465 [Cherax quadricarinatus]|uniref:Uncharacterized protein n=1 Tax=Cherax quadricarinatus TaxID=27406 RepID=A0AAW0Y0W5_CHEQU